MLLTITTTHAPATDLGYLLHKHPSRAQTFPLSFGQAHVFYPEASEARCTAALLLDVDPIALVRGRHGTPGGARGLLTEYVNDRPYVASSLLSVAIGQVFGTALAGRCAARPELAAQALPLRACLVPLPCRGGVSLLQDLFAPLGYTVSATGHPLDAHAPDWGPSCYATVTLEGQCRLAELLNASLLSSSRCSTTRNTTGSATPRWRSSCATAQGGWRSTPPEGASPHAISNTSDAWPARRWRAWRTMTMPIRT